MSDFEIFVLADELKKVGLYDQVLKLLKAVHVEATKSSRSDKSDLLDNVMSDLQRQVRQ